MDTKSRPATAQEIIKMKQMLRSARNRYENKVLAIEKIWSELKPHDYANRKLITDLTIDLLDIDASLKVWENKLHE